ncbi:MAG: murein L,D-transpeptidase [Clostridia bacterium]|nr:murein L,D-transpeptidase [Clostridia bacterium]MBR6499222.1 murein L,D-transpeptidase [Clostridia bacterium]
MDQALWDTLSGDGFVLYRQTVKSGATGRETKRLQTRLRTLGYLSGAADGVAGARTAEAIRTFQMVNGLSADGVAGEKTQKLLFSPDAKRCPKGSGRYMLKVSTKDQRVYAYAWDSATASYSLLARTMKCSTGLDKTPTPKGTFSGSPVARWGYFPKFNVWAQYLYRINGHILFHSVLYNSQNENSLIQGSVYKLGSKASHGCVRLSVEDAKWVYQNCPAGTKITVY